MKKIIVILGVVLATVWLWQQRGMAKKILVAPLPSPSPLTDRSSAFGPALGLSINDQSLKTVTVGKSTYRTTWLVIDNPAEIRIGINENLASSSAEIRQRERCVSLTSAAFYGQNDLPIGMVVAGGQELSPWQENYLFNGVLGWNGTLLAVSALADKEYTWALQAGPVVYRDGKPAALKLKNDQSARRILAGVTDDGRLWLAVVLAEDSLFSGPTLAEVPALVPVLAELTGVKLVSVMNLDGGTASAFTTPDITLRELKPIGSYICVR